MENRRVGASKRDRYGLDLSSKKVDLKKGKKKKLGVSTLEEYLAPGLKDSSFGKLTEEVMFEILKNLSRILRYSFDILILFYSYSFFNLT